jgi:hypothetical protein
LGIDRNNSLLYNKQKQTIYGVTMNTKFEPKLYTNVSLEALKLNITLEYRLWCIMRSFVQTTHGTETGATKVHQLTHENFRKMLNTLGFSRQLYYKFVNSSPTTFFTVTDDYITFKGLSNVCKTLNVMPGHVYRMPIELMKKFDIFNAYCYYGYFANHINNVMQSRETIATETNVSKVTQIKYEGILGITKFRNYFVFDPNGYNDGLEIAESIIEKDAIVNITNINKTKTYLLFQSVNTYLAFTRNIQLFNDKETRRIYAQNGVPMHTAYRNDTQQSGKELTPNVLNVRLFTDKNVALRGLIANEVDSHFINEFNYLRKLTLDKNTRVFFVHNFSQVLKDDIYAA